MALEEPFYWYFAVDEIEGKVKMKFTGMFYIQLIWTDKMGIESGYLFKHISRSCVAFIKTESNATL